MGLNEWPQHSTGKRAAGEAKSFDMGILALLFYKKCDKLQLGFFRARGILPSICSVLRASKNNASDLEERMMKFKVLPIAIALQIRIK